MRTAQRIALIGYGAVAQAISAPLSILRAVLNRSAGVIV